MKSVKKIKVLHKKGEDEVDSTISIPSSIFDKCRFDENGAIDGLDFVDEYLRDVHKIYCINWWEINQ